MHRSAVLTLGLALALAAGSAPATAMLSGWPAEVTFANNALMTATSFRVTATEGTAVTNVELGGGNRERLVLPGNAVVVREADDSDGVSAAHLYHVIYPGGTPQIRWYVRVSDGLVHRIRRPGRYAPMTLTIDRYRGVPRR